MNMASLHKTNMNIGKLKLSVPSHPLPGCQTDKNAATVSKLDLVRKDNRVLRPEGENRSVVIVRVLHPEKRSGYKSAGGIAAIGEGGRHPLGKREVALTMCKEKGKYIYIVRRRAGCRAEAVRALGLLGLLMGSVTGHPSPSVTQTVQLAITMLFAAANKDEGPVRVLATKALCDLALSWCVSLSTSIFVRHYSESCGTATCTCPLCPASSRASPF